MEYGLKATEHDHRDYDFIKTKRLAGIIPAFPENWNTDVGLWMPDQNKGTPAIPPMPYGCTNYAQTDLLIDEDKTLYNPMDLENITHANERGGIGLRESLSAVVKLHPAHPKYFNVQPDIPQGGVVDYFDAVRLAILIGQNENRAVSVGTVWLAQFQNTQNGIVPQILSWPSEFINGHNWCVKGWKTINGVTYLIGKPWIGKGFGDGGFCYFSRPVFNRLMKIPGSVAYTLDKLLPGEQPIAISSSVKQWLVSFFTNIFAKK